MLHEYLNKPVINIKKMRKTANMKVYNLIKTYKKAITQLLIK